MPVEQPVNPSDLGRDSHIVSRRWARFPTTYRANELHTLTRWLQLGESGCVVGLPGAGRSTLLGYLYQRPDAMAAYWHAPADETTARPVFVIPLDLNMLPDSSVATLYRAILRAFDDARWQFSTEEQHRISAEYQRHAAAQDAFLPQSALLSLLTAAQQADQRIVLVLNRFDEFCHSATPSMMRTLRGLRDAFKETLCYLLGMMRPLAQLPHLDLIEPLIDVVDLNTCWIGPLSDADARHMLNRMLHGAPATSAESDAILSLTAGHASLIRTVCNWLLNQPQRPPVESWDELLLQERKVQRRLNLLWDHLTQEEQFSLSELERVQAWPASRRAEKQRILEPLNASLAELAQKELCQQQASGWQPRGILFTQFVAQLEGRGRGRIWLDADTNELFQGQTRLHDLAPLEHAALAFFARHPQERHSYSDIIDAVWPPDTVREGVSTEALYQTVRSLRKKIESVPGKPVYITNWRGQPEGGYQFFPEGLPRA